MNTDHQVRKTTEDEIKQIELFRLAGKKPKEISKLLNLDINTVRYYTYGSRIKNKKIKTKSINSKSNSKRKYYRDKKENWLIWKADCLISSLKRRHSKSNIPYTFLKSRKEMGKFIEDNMNECNYCKEKLTKDTVSLDHKLPVSRGGDSTKENLIFCCKKCNSSKGSMTDIEYKQLIELTSTWEDKGKYLNSRLRGGNYIFGRKK